MPAYISPLPSLNASTRAALALSLCMWASSAWADSISQISLSTAGLAEVVRQVDVPEQGPISLTVPLDQVDDVLKTLLLNDPEQRIQGLTLAGQAPIDSSLAGLPFKEYDLSSVHALAARLRGVEVQAYANGRSIKGTVLGVDTQTQQNGKTSYSLSLLGSEGQVQTLVLGADSHLQILDSRIQEQLQQASQVLARQTNENTRELHLLLAPTQAKKVELRYLIAAPVWKSTYRLILDKNNRARLQAWAVVENTTGEDWKNVSLTLSSGSPVVYQQALLQQYWATRPNLPVAVGSSQAPAADRLTATLAPAPMAMAEAAQASKMAVTRQSARQASGRAYAAYDMAGGNVASTEEGQTVVRFTLPDPVTAASGQTVSVPFQDHAIEAQSVSVYFQDQSSPHPSAALYLKNTLDSSLPPGIMTVFDEHLGHVGDAELAGLPSGDARLVYFARDDKVQVRQEENNKRELTQTQIAQGMAKTTWKQTREWTYSIQGATQESRVVLIDLPRQSGWEFNSAHTSEQTSQSYRLKVTVPAGKTVEVKADFSRLDSEEIRLEDLDENFLRTWGQSGLPDKWKQALPELISLRTQQSQAQQQLQQSQEQLQEQIAEQQRVRENLTAVNDQSNLGQRFAQQLGEQEDAIAQLRERVQKQREQWQQARERFQQALAKL